MQISEDLQLVVGHILMNTPCISNLHNADCPRTAVWVQFEGVAVSEMHILRG